VTTISSLLGQSTSVSYLGIEENENTLNMSCQQQQQLTMALAIASMAARIQDRIHDSWMFLPRAVSLKSVQLLLLYFDNFLFIFHLHLNQFYHLIYRQKKLWDFFSI